MLSKGLEGPKSSFWGEEKRQGSLCAAQHAAPRGKLGGDKSYDRPGKGWACSHLPTLCGRCSSHRWGAGERPSTWMTTKRWGSLAMRENSATSSRNLGRHSESIIQPGGTRKLSIPVLAAAFGQPRPHSLVCFRHPLLVSIALSRLRKDTRLWS